jgi:NADH dehydrogenase [ubiquinone] 1 alpha subcomplex assembly factor 5
MPTTTSEKNAWPNFVFLFDFDLFSPLNSTMFQKARSAVTRSCIDGLARTAIPGNLIFTECAREHCTLALWAHLSVPISKGNPRLWKMAKRRHSSINNEVFDKELLLRRRSNSVALFGADGTYDYLRRECAERLVDRLDDISRPFPEALDLGCDTGHVFTALTCRNGSSGETLTGGVQSLVQTDTACFLSSPQNTGSAIVSGESWSENGISTRFNIIDDENLELSPGSYDLILSSLHLHWVNHLPGLLDRVKRALRPDGAFVGCMLGGSTLRELRHCFFLAEQERRGGVSPHCSPFARPSDVSALMQGAGFALPTIDVDTITVSMSEAFNDST